MLSTLSNLSAMTLKFYKNILVNFWKKYLKKNCQKRYNEFWFFLKVNKPTTMTGVALLFFTVFARASDGNSVGYRVRKNNENLKHTPPVPFLCLFWRGAFFWQGFSLFVLVPFFWQFFSRNLCLWCLFLQKWQILFKI